MKYVALCLGLGLVLALSCGRGRQQQPSIPSRAFPMAEVPMMIEDSQERLSWLAEHFWDAFTAPDSLYCCDSVTVNGVSGADVEKQMGVYATILQEVSPQTGERAMSHFFSRTEAFQKAHPSANVFSSLTALCAKYFYDPNSPVRSEELYLPFVSGMAASPLVDTLTQRRYAREAAMCRLNRPGTPAADFRFIDTDGRARTLYGIRARYTLLIFGNPDCKACGEIAASLSEDPLLSSLVGQGVLKVVDIFIDDDIDLWKARLGSYPSDWINGYDPSLIIREDLLYHVRALPSLYLLDASKTVLLKDAPPEQVFAALSSL